MLKQKTILNTKYFTDHSNLKPSQLFPRSNNVTFMEKSQSRRLLQHERVSQTTRIQSSHPYKLFLPLTAHTRTTVDSLSYIYLNTITVVSVHRLDTQEKRNKALSQAQVLSV